MKANRPNTVGQQLLTFAFDSQHRCDIVSNSYNIVPTLQRCVALKVKVKGHTTAVDLYRQKAGADGVDASL